jgi:hypothetical protein
MGLPGRSTRRPRQGQKASLLVAGRFGSWRGGQRELEDIDVLRTHFSMESKNRDLGRTDPNWGNASLLRARNAGCLDHLFRPVCLSGRDRPYLVSYLVSSGPCPPAGIGMDGEAWEGLRSRSLTRFACSLTGLSGSRKHDSRPRLLRPGQEKLVSNGTGPLSRIPRSARMHDRVSAYKSQTGIRLMVFRCFRSGLANESGGELHKVAVKNKLRQKIGSSRSECTE